MTRPRTAKAIAKAEDAQAGLVKRWLFGSVIFVGAAAAAGAVFADSHEVIIESHAYSNFGEVKYPADFAHLDYVNPDAPKGGEIAQWGQGNFDSFNPFAREGTSAALSSITQESLMQTTSDDAYGMYCYMCTTLEYPESKDWVIFNLRDDVTFSDGTPMTAEDVKFSVDLILEQAITEYRNVVSGYLDSVEVIDEYTVRFNFTDAAPEREAIPFAGGSTIFSKAWFEDTGSRLDERTEAPFLGTGAYLLDDFEYNRSVKYSKDPDWWGADHPLNIGRQNFESIRVEYFADSAAAFEAFKTGEYTFRAENSSKQWATLYDFPAIDNGWVKVDELPNGNIGTAQGFVFNLDREKWQDPKVREAIRLMVNFEWMNESLFYGLYDRPISFWDNSPLAATGTPDAGEVALLQPLVDEGLLDASILTDEAVMPPVSASVNRPLDRGMLRKASALLDEAGWISGDDGMRRKDGQTLETVFLQFSPQFDRIVNPIVESLRALGVDAKLERVDSAQFVERRRSGDFDLVNHSPGQELEPGFAIRQWFGSETADASSRNLMRLRSPGVDKLLDVVIAAQTLDDLETSVHALDRVLRAEGFWIPQWFKSTYWVAYYDMYRYPENLPPFALGEMDFWWYDAEAAEALKAAGAIK